MDLFKKISIRNISLIVFLIFLVFEILIIFLSALSSYNLYRMMYFQQNLNKIDRTLTVLKVEQKDLVNKNLSQIRVADFKRLKNISRRIGVQIDSLLEEDFYLKDKFTDNFFLIKGYVDDYQQVIDDIQRLLVDIYEPKIGTEAKIKLIEERIIEHPEYKKLNLIDYFYKIKNLREQFFEGKINKIQFERSTNLLLEEVSKKADKTNYFVVLFQDLLNDYASSTLVEYSKLSQIGTDPAKGKLNKMLEYFDLIDNQIEKINNFIDKRMHSKKRLIIIYFFIFLFVFSFLIFFIMYSAYQLLAKPWKAVEPFLRSIEAGSLEKIRFNSKIVEINQIIFAFNSTIDGLIHKKNILQSLAEGKYDVETDFLQTDELGETILELKKNLIKTQQETTAFRETEENQKWTATGLAKIGAVMRKFTDSVEDLSQNILKSILDYVEAASGAIYITDFEKNVLKLTSFYSYGKKRIRQQEVEPYEGLIGTIFIEKKHYYFEQVPEDYILVETAVGYAKPKALIAFPLLFEDKVYGVIELSFLEQVPKYKRQFLLDLANELAIAISYTLINIQTQQLLKHSEQQAKELQANERLFRKNQDNLKSLLRMTEQRLNDIEQELKYKEDLLKQKVSELMQLEQELNKKDEDLENITAEYENMLAELKKQNTELRKRIEELERRLNKDH